MFQTFDDIADPTKGAARVARLRDELARRNLKGFLVPRADEHQGEYVPPHAERLAWLTGFSGSAGLAVVLGEKAAVFVDGRYTLQVRDQVDTDLFETLQTPEHRPSKWLADVLEKGDALGYDPRLHSIKAIERLETALEPTGATLVAQDSNPVDAIWDDQPPPPTEPVVPHPIELAGVAASEKIAEAQKTLRDAKADAAVLTQPDSIAWLFNIRGGDVGHTPLPLSFAIVSADSRPELFIDPRKLSDNVRGHIAEIAETAAPDALEARLAEIGASGARVGLDPETASRWIADRLKAAGAEIVEGQDPCLLPKAKKNTAEIAGTRAAHLRDGAAVCRFLAWLDGHGPSGEIDEIAAAQQLEAFRQDTGALKDISFDTISGAGANGAIVHYRVTQSTNAKLEPGSLYLVDSGAQY
ncbi:MAG: aminopeptidase P family N-terminal domain-containing protein, partial [Methyloligellaceae bacterium]